LYDIKEEISGYQFIYSLPHFELPMVLVIPFELFEEVLYLIEQVRFITVQTYLHLREFL
jgi:hypothetical protein